MSTRTLQQYFERAYTADAQVFGHVDGWYETRKRQILLSSLLRPRYLRAFEPGGGVAALTIPLAARCDQVLMMDWSVTVLKYAREAMRDFANVEFCAGSIPEGWPEHRRFDLIVFSEILYYLTEDEVAEVVHRTCRSLCAHGEVALLHWRHASADYPLTAARAHDIFISMCADLHVRVAHEDRDFLLHILA